MGLSTKHVSDLGRAVTLFFENLSSRNRSIHSRSPLLTQLEPVREKLGAPAHKNRNLLFLRMLWFWNLRQRH